MNKLLKCVKLMNKQLNQLKVIDWCQITAGQCITFKIVVKLMDKQMKQLAKSNSYTVEICQINGETVEIAQHNE